VYCVDQWRVGRVVDDLQGDTAPFCSLIESCYTKSAVLTTDIPIEKKEPKGARHRPSGSFDISSQVFYHEHPARERLDIREAQPQYCMQQQGGPATQYSGLHFQFEPRVLIQFTTMHKQLPQKDESVLPGLEKQSHCPSVQAMRLQENIRYLFHPGC
jgi:hypothetical protein